MLTRIHSYTYIQMGPMHQHSHARLFMRTHTYIHTCIHTYTQMGQMHQLRHVTLRENKLTGFPDVLCKLVGAEQINLSDNKKASFTFVIPVLRLAE